MNNFTNLNLIFSISSILINLGAGADTLQSAYAAATLPQFGSSAFTTTPLAGNPALAQAVAAAAGKQIEGKYTYIHFDLFQLSGEYAIMHITLLTLYLIWSQ